jgi:hypothetical protein
MSAVLWVDVRMANPPRMTLASCRGPFMDIIPAIVLSNHNATPKWLTADSAEKREKSKH